MLRIPEYFEHWNFRVVVLRRPRRSGRGSSVEPRAHVRSALRWCCRKANLTIDQLHTRRGRFSPENDLPEPGPAEGAPRFLLCPGPMGVRSGVRCSMQDAQALLILEAAYSLSESNQAAMRSIA